ncbi:MAG TPA: LysR substrate-binding domain-containing protein [Gemmatimonadales bacterium]|nr:LysR substrate-binding domain-containing protein [Gemmatimonadales bacterium]
MPLPRLPLNALRAFETTVRLSSMSAAAAELGVTHGAVSRHIRELEDQFGLPLLLRLPKSVTPTPAGSQLAVNLRQAFELMHAGVARLAPGPLTLSCSATIAMNWLIPRLRAFKHENPAIEVRLNINYGAVDFIRDEVSLAIRLSMYHAPEDVIVRPLLHEDIGPICHPDYAGRLELHKPEDLLRTRILGTATRPDAWSDWLAVIGRSDLNLQVHESHEHHYLMIQAASYGLGIAMAPRILVAEEIERGHLVAPLGFVPGPHELNLWIAPHVRSREDVRRLSSWIQDEMTRHATAGTRDATEASYTS